MMPSDLRLARIDDRLNSTRVRLVLVNHQAAKEPLQDARQGKLCRHWSLQAIPGRPHEGHRSLPGNSDRRKRQGNGVVARCRHPAARIPSANRGFRALDTRLATCLHGPVSVTSRLHACCMDPVVTEICLPGGKVDCECSGWRGIVVKYHLHTSAVRFTC